MKILYGVQATGNGHITRARAMVRELSRANLEVDYLFSGRDCEGFFDMEIFGEYRCMSGMTFATDRGRVLYFKTIFKNNIFEFLKDIFTLDVTQYDLVITDFEPITAWAARLRKKACIGIGHQYAFGLDIPVAGRNPVSDLILKYFAPVRKYLGLHWHHFNQPILPPLIEPFTKQGTRIKNKIVVYLPFDELSDTMNWLRHADTHDFFIYCDVQKSLDENNLHLRPFNRQGFIEDLSDASGIISNAGFELLSEALYLGLKIMIKPLSGQMEQISNAKALKGLGYGDVISTYERDALNSWLVKNNPIPHHYPNVAMAIVNWIKGGMHEDVSTLSRLLWEEVSQYPLLRK